MVAPGIDAALAELHETSLVLGSFMVTIYVLGYAVGPLFLGPLSEVYGRYPVVILATWFFNAWLLGCALAPNMPGLVVMRFLAGIGGSAVMTIAPAMVSDLYPVERRAFAMSCVTMAQSVGPASELPIPFCCAPTRTDARAQLAPSVAASLPSTWAGVG